MPFKLLIVQLAIASGLFLSGCFSTGARNKYYQRGIELFDQGKYNEAASAFGRAAERVSVRENALFNQGLSHLKAHRFQDAVSVYERLLTHEPGSAEAHINLAYALNGLDRANEAENHFVKAIELDSARVYPYCSYARFLLDKNEEAADALADRHIAEAERINPDDSTAVYLRGVIADRNRDKDQARSAFRRAVTLDGANVPALIRLGQIEIEDSAYHTAVNRFIKAAVLEPENTAAWLGAARCYRHLGRYRRALQALWKVEALEPRHSDLDLELTLTLADALRRHLGLSSGQDADDLLEPPDLPVEHRQNL